MFLEVQVSALQVIFSVWFWWISKIKP